MNESKEIEGLSAIAEAKDLTAQHKRPARSWVRVSPGPYMAFASVLAFIAALLLRAHYDTLALILIGTILIIVPILALNDLIVFDGVSIRRRSPGYFLLRSILGKTKQLLVSDFETVETNAVRTLRRGGSVRYRYRTQINGKGKEFVIASGGEAYRRLIRQLLPCVHEDKLDNRSRDLRDYLSDPSFVNRKTQLSQLASDDILDTTQPDYKVGGKSKYRSEASTEQSSPQELERSHLLRRLGNELRVAGRLRESGEAFRRALNVRPKGAWLMY